VHAARMVPSGAFGLPRTEDSGSVRAERWEEANRSKSDPPPRVHKEKTLQYVPAPHGTPIEGIEIRGSQIIKVEVLADSSFEMSPFASSLCIPLQLRLNYATDGEPEMVSSTNRLLALRLMTEPGIGLPMTWQSVATNSTGALPPMLVTRADGVPFREAEWQVLAEYVQFADEELEEQQARKPSVFANFVCSHLLRIGDGAESLFHPPGQVPLYFIDVVPALAIRVPPRSTVRPRRLKGQPELNGRMGTVVKYDEAKLRVGVEFPAPMGVVSIRASNLEITPRERSRKLLDEHERRRRAEYGRRCAAN